MTATYEKLDVRFYYPENWTISDEQRDGWPRGVTIQSPKTAFWSLHIYQPALPPSELAAQVVQAMQEEYSDLEVQTERLDLDGWDMAGFSMGFSCLDRFVRACVLGVIHEDRTFLALAQAEDSEFDQLEQVFLAITTSLLRFSRSPSESDEPPQSDEPSESDKPPEYDEPSEYGEPQ